MIRNVQSTAANQSRTVLLDFDTGVTKHYDIAANRLHGQVFSFYPQQNNTFILIRVQF